MRLKIDFKSPAQCRNQMTDGMKTTEFMLNLQARLIEERKVAESTATQYLQTLWKLSGEKKFNNLAWAKKYEDVQKIIDTYAPSTQNSQYCVLASVLSLFADKPSYKKVYRYWREKSSEAHKAASNKDVHKMTEKQEENWLQWDEVEKKMSGLKEDVSSLVSLKKLNEGQYDTLLQFVVLSLYTDIPPRRNQDYLDMYVVKKLPKEYAKDKNFYDLQSKQFIFNKYKTAKTYGEQRIAVPEELQSALASFMKFHPHKREKEFKLLVKQDGTALNTVNAITRILNRVFDRAVGSSMLRHIYLSSRYNGSSKEMDETADAMAHSRAVQNTYIKNEEE
jgi:integrase